MAAQPEGRQKGRRHVGGLDQPATAQRFRSTPIRLPNGVVKHCSALQSIMIPEEAAHPAKRPAF
jgi:hypothetical protein